MPGFHNPNPIFKINPLRRRWLIMLLVCLVGMAFFPARKTQAHPADMYTQTQEITLTDEGFNVVWTVYPGPLLTANIWYDADKNGDEDISEAEAIAWAEGRLNAMTMSLDNSPPLDLTIDKVEWPSDFVKFQIGDEKIFIHLSATWPAFFSGSHHLSLDNNYEETITINWFYLTGENGVNFTRPGQKSGQLDIEFTLSDDSSVADENVLTYWDSGMPALGAADSPGEAQEAAQKSAVQDNRPTTVLTNLVREKNLSLAFYLSAFTVAMVLGSVHALTPGHGKALVAAYLVGARGTMRHAMTLGAVVTLTHTGSVLIIGMVTLVASRYIVPDKLFPILEVASGLLILSMGAGMLRNRWLGFRGVMRRRARLKQESQSEKPATDSSGGKKRVIAIGEKIETRAYDKVLPGGDSGNGTPGTLEWRSLIALGISGGIVPCPDAIAILLVAYAIGRITLGLVLILIFSMGMAAILIVIGIVVVRSRRTFDSQGRLTSFAPALSVMSAVVVLGLGLGLTVNALGRADLSTVIRERSEKIEAEEGGQDARPFNISTASVIYLSAGGANGTSAPDKTQLFITPLASGEFIQLTFEPEGVADYALSPDKSTIAYAVPGDSGDVDLWAMDTNGRNRRAILDCVEATCSAAVWSPDGQRLVYERLDFNAPDSLYGVYTIWWVNPFNGETGPVFQDSNLPGYNPRWSPDGQWLSYVSSTNNGGIQIYNLRSGESINIENQSGMAAVWQPDSSGVLVFEVGVEKTQYLTHLSAFDIESQEKNLLTDDPYLQDEQADPSPDGEWLAVVRSQISSNGVSRGNQVWVMRPDGTESRQLTDMPDVVYGRPLWSPDGKYILFYHYTLGIQWSEPQVSMVDVESGVVMKVVEPGFWPTWLP